MKALDEYFLMVVFTLLLNRDHVFAIFMFKLDRNKAVKGLTDLVISKTIKISSITKFQKSRPYSVHTKCNLLCSIYSTKVWHHHFANFSIRTFKPHHVIHTAAVRTWAKFQITSNESEDREILQSHSNLSYLASVPNHRTSTK